MSKLNRAGIAHEHWAMFDQLRHRTGINVDAQACKLRDAVRLLLEAENGDDAYFVVEQGFKALRESKAKPK